LKWHFQYVEKTKPESISAAMLLGSCVHRMIQDHLMANLASEEPPGAERLMVTYRELWERESKTAPVQYANRQDAKTVEETARRMIQSFLESPLASPEGEIIGIEERFLVQLDRGLPDLAGRVDLITRYGNQLVVTDFKTARSMWTAQMADDHAEQLILYAQGCRPIAQVLEAHIHLQFVVITKAKAPKIEALGVKPTYDKMQRSRTIMRQVFHAMQTGVVYPAPSVLNCGSCPFQTQCRTWHRTGVSGP
jgi:RecB family exonuclease